jgi:hypothetical protein
MRSPTQPKFADFIPRFLGLLFRPEDRVVLAHRQPPQCASDWINHSDTLENVVSLLLSGYAATSNVYFRASAHDGTCHFGKTNCVRVRALFLDLDCGLAGHAKPSPFATLDDATGYLLTLPVRPSIAWQTGHGVQAAFLLREPYLFPAGGGDPDSSSRYEAVSAKLSAMSMSDGTFTPEHAFRLPLSVNEKWWSEPPQPAVTGELLWCKDDLTYTFDQLAGACAAYGVEEHLHQARHAQEAKDASGAEEDPKAVQDAPYESLPEDVRQDVERAHDERSGAMFSLIGRLIRQGYGDPTIRDAIRRGPDFQRKYRGRLNAEVDRCICKIRSGRYVFPGELAPAITIYNTPVSVRLSECPPLPPALDAMLDRYAKRFGLALSGRVRTAARFHEHVFGTVRSGVLETPCGSGKSTWAFAHIALNATVDSRHLYVVETVEALHRAADTLQALADVPVGRVHGFKREHCHELCGIWRDWRDCGRRHPRSACHTCVARARCCFYNRDTEESKPILCLTHNGLVRLLEDNSPVLDDASILVDEGLSPFNTAEFTLSELEDLQALAQNVNPELGRVFPYSRLAHEKEFVTWDLPEAADTFARRAYVFRDENQTAALQGVYDALRTCAGVGLAEDPFHQHPGDAERAGDTLTRLLNFTRPSRAYDATYAFRELYDDKGTRYAVTRSRFSFDTQRPYRRLWVLNASAQLSPYQYPDGMPVYGCQDLPDNSHLLTLHVAVGHPTKNQQELTVRTSQVLLAFGNSLRRHTRILVATDKDERSLPAITEQLQRLHGTNAQIVHLTRGRIKGSNAAGECTLAYLTGMSTFTTLDDCALHAALLLRRTFADRPFVYRMEGGVNWPGGMPYLPIMRTLYALRSLDEIYQSLWRTCLRNDRPAEAIITVPFAHWLVALWRTVMPRFVMGNAKRERFIPASEICRLLPPVPPERHDPRSVVADWRFETDELMEGLRIVNSAPGTEFTKKQVAEELGYKDWGKSKRAIMGLLGDFFEDVPDNVQRLRRRTPPDWIADPL